MVALFAHGWSSEGKKAKHTSASTGTSLAGHQLLGRSNRKTRCQRNLASSVGQVQWSVTASVQQTKLSFPKTYCSTSFYPSVAQMFINDYIKSESGQHPSLPLSRTFSLPALYTIQYHGASGHWRIQCRVNQSESPSNSETSGSLNSIKSNRPSTFEVIVSLIIDCSSSVKL